MTKVHITPRPFADGGLAASAAALEEEVRQIYLSDRIPWVVGYSGGKDSTAVLQLVWRSLAGLAPEERTKKVHVISTDTMVENPVVASWVAHSLAQMQAAADEAGLPIEPHRLTPAVRDSFWVNLIGKGYPAPRPKFRWCTERLKIKPSNEFVRRMVRQNGEAIVVLGTRKAESSTRHALMAKLEKGRVRDRLSPNTTMPNSLVYSPIENWSNDEVWLFLMQYENPWGYDNHDLLTMYRGASEDNECPLVIDTTTPSCGDSRFGCWVCTLVEKDKSMQAMIQNDEEKEWMLPLLELRNELDVADDRHLRDWRRIDGRVQLFHDRTIPGPYTQGSREMWLRKLLEAQEWIRKYGPENVRSIELITRPELEEIRRIWLEEKHEIEDRLPRIYSDITREEFSEERQSAGIGASELELLNELSGDDRLHYELVRELLDLEQRYKLMARRVGLFDAFDTAFKRAYYDDKEDAMEFAKRKRDAGLETDQRVEEARLHAEGVLIGTAYDAAEES